MKKVSRALAAIVSFIMVFCCFVGCNKAGTKSVDDPNIKAEIDKGAKLTVLSPNHIDGAEGDIYEAANKRFKDDYGVDVQIVSSTWGDWIAKYSATISAGDPADVILCGCEDCLRFTMEGKLQPIDNFVDSSAHGFWPDVMKQNFCFDGGIYLACGQPQPWGLFYNKDKFQDKGIEDPMEQYKNGTWTFENFNNVCRTVNDPDNLCYAVSGYYMYPWMGANNTSLVKQNDDGTFSSNIESEPVQEVLQLVQDMRSKYQYYNLEGDNPVQSFMSGHNVMFTDFAWAYQDILKYKKDNGDTIDVGFVPAPYGRNNVTEHKVTVNSGGHGISAGSDCPYLAGKYIEYLGDEDAKVTGDYLGYLKSKGYEPDDQLVQDIIDCGSRATCPSITDSLVSNGGELFDSVGGGEAVSSTIDMYKEVYAQTVNDKVAAWQKKLNK